MTRTRTAPGRIVSRVLALVALVVTLAVPAGAHALAIPQSVEALARESRSVVIARVVAVSSRWSVSGTSAGEIVSDVDLVVDHRLAGPGGSTVRVTVPGGQVGDLVMVIDEAPRFVPGQRCILFLDGSGRVVADRQGKLDVVGGRVPGVRQSLATVETRIRQAITPPTSDPWYGVVQDLVSSAPEPATAALAGAPTIAGITPLSQSAGTGTSVTIEGTGFGPALGSVTFYKDSGNRAAGLVLSWSHTSIVCQIPSGAGSGPVIVTDSGGAASAGYDYTIGFSYSGRHWQSTTMTYYINPNCLDATTDEVTGVQTAAEAWNVPTPFRFVYAGLSVATANPSVYNGLNEIYWASSGFTSDKTLAWNRCWYSSSDPTKILESDIVFNDSFAWGDASISGGVYDIASVAIHELGHSLSLDDQYGAGDSGKVMYGFGWASHVHRTLSLEDAKGIAFIFGWDSTPPVTSAAVNGAAVSAGSTTAWLKTASVTLSANEPGTSYYNLDAGQTAYATPFGVTPDGTHALSYWSFDAAGNSETPKSITVRVDSTRPTTSASVSATYVVSASITIVPRDTGGSGVWWTDYQIDASTPASGTLATTSVLGAHTIRHRAVDFAGNVGAWSTPAQSFTVVAPTYTLTYTAGANGTISGTSPQTVSSGGSGTAVTAVPNAGYHFTSWSDGGLTAARTDSNVTANKSVTAGFAIDTPGAHTLTYWAGVGGTISGATPQTVASGGSGTAVTAVASTGYHFVKWSDNVMTAARTDSNVTADKSVTASFAINTYTLTYTAGAHGTISGTSPQTVNYNGSGTAVTAVASTGYHFTSWSDASTANPRTDRNVIANKSVTANFAADGTTPSLTPVYRFYNLKMGVHFYTASATEMANVRDTLYRTYRLEGVAYNLNTANPANNTPLYRFYNIRKGVHFYTASEAEKDTVIRTLSGTYRYEGAAYNVSLSPAGGATPVYRFYNLKQGVHFYTASEAERDTVVRTLSSTYRLEGVGYYLAP